MLATVDFDRPIVWAILIGWIMSVVLHEFAHGLVAYLGGDYTIRERGGLTLNPFQYIDPLFSIVMPAIFLMMGGIPLPGGVTYIRRDLLRSNGWNSAVSLAGPVMNFILFLACAIPLHPAFHWAPYRFPMVTWTNGQEFLAAMAVLQLMAVFLNLVPVPPLDGFQAISPYLTDEQRIRFTTPPLSTILLFGYFLVLWKVPRASEMLYDGVDRVLLGLGFGHVGSAYFARSLVTVLYGES